MTTRITSTAVATIGPGWVTAVRRSLELHGRTVTDLAGSIECSRQYLARILAGEPTIPVETYLAICNDLQIDPNKHAKIGETTPPWEFSK